MQSNKNINVILCYIMRNAAITFHIKYLNHEQTV